MAIQRINRIKHKTVSTFQNKSKQQQGSKIITSLF